MIDAIIPAYNAKNTLTSTIESVLSQAAITRVIVVDDGSTDHTLELAKSFAPAVKTITGPNRGVSVARNKGILETNGDWVQFVDSDDLLAPETIQKRLEVARSTGADVIVSNWAEFGSKDCIEKPKNRVRMADWARLKSEGAELACATSFWAPPAAILYKRKVVQSIGGFREDLPVIQDARFLFDAARNGATFAHANHTGAFYRVSPGSLSRQNSRNFWLDILRNGAQIDLLWQSDGIDSIARKNAISDMYLTCANALLREGDPHARSTYRVYLSRGGKPQFKLKIGNWILARFGASAVRRVFAAGQDVSHAGRQFMTTILSKNS